MSVLSELLKENFSSESFEYSESDDENYYVVFRILVIENGENNKYKYIDLTLNFYTEENFRCKMTNPKNIEKLINIQLVNQGSKYKYSGGEYKIIDIY